MLPMFCVSLVALLPILSSADSKFAYVIYINEKIGTNSEKCLQPNNGSQACKDFDWVLQNSSTGNSTQFIFAEGTHDIRNSFPPFQNLNQLQFTGRSTTISCTQPGIGFAFVNVQEISFYNLKIVNCSTLRSSTSREPSDTHSVKFELFYVAVYMLMCSSVIMENIVIQESSNGTAVVMYNVVGDNAITNSAFGMNNYDRHPGCGGLLIEFTYCVPGDENCCDDKMNDSIGYYNSGGHYLFENVTFYNNSAVNSVFLSEDDSYFIPYKTMHHSFGMGGGLALIFKGNSAHNHFILRHCDFIENAARRGSGFFINFQDFASNNTVLIEDGLFLHNGVADPQDLQSTGGGLMVGHYIYSDGGSDINIVRNTLQVVNCNFIGNRAFYGGGGSIFLTRIKTNNISNVFSVTIKNTNFARNVAQLGAAIEASLFSLFVDGPVSTIQIEASNFTSNSIYSENSFSTYEDGVGSVYTNSVPIHFVGSILFEDNQGSALGMVGTRIDFTDCQGSFIGNTGRYGGGINILGSAFILVNSNTALTFINNYAHIQGGAIANSFTEKDNFETNLNCFVRHTDPFSSPENWDAKFVFINNSAASLGPSIYTTSLLPCTWVGGKLQENLTDVFRWKGWTYYSNKNVLSSTEEIATSVGNIIYDNIAAVNGSHVIKIKSIPGQKIKLPLQIEDDMSQNAAPDAITFIARFLLNNSADVSSTHTFVTGERKIQLWGHKKSQVKVTLDSLGERHWHVELDVHLTECPPGYFLPKESSKLGCTCLSYHYKPNVQCHPNYKAMIQKGFWIGKTEKGKVELFQCPLSYCYDYEDSQIYYDIPQEYSKLNDAVCDHSREGILCGFCKENYGISVTTEKLTCIHCNNTRIISNIIRYVSSVYLPLLILFTLLLLFQVRLSSGPANSFIFYAQTVTSTLGLTADGHIYFDTFLKGKDKFMKVHRIVYGIFNLRVVENMIRPLCIHNKLNALDVFQLSYLVALFPLLFILVVILAVKIKDNLCCRRHTWNYFPCRYLRKCNIRNGLLHVFAAFLLLSYNRLMLSSFFILNHTSRRVLYAGQYEITDHKYVWRYALPAVCVLCITFLLPIALLKYPITGLEKCINKFKWLSKLYPADKIHIFLDTFQGCYRDDRRYFAGIYFLFRIFWGVANLIGRNWFHQYTIQHFVCMIFVLVICILHPYRKEFWYLNSVDLLMFTNLATVNGLSFLLLSFNVSYNDNAAIFQYVLYTQQVLIYLPLVCMVFFLMWKAIPKACRKIMRKIARKLVLKGMKIKSKLLYRPHVTVNTTARELLSEQDDFLTTESPSNAASSPVKLCDGYSNQCSVVKPPPHYADAARSLIVEESEEEMEEKNKVAVNEMSSLAKSCSSNSKRSTYGLL